VNIKLTNQLKYQFLKPQFILFILCGGIAAVVNIVARMGLNFLFPYSVAIVIAYIIGMITAFFLNKLFVFQKTTQKTNRQVFYFTVVNLLAVAQTLVISLLLVDVIFPLMNYTFQTKTVAHCIGVVVPVFTSYIGHKYWSFAE